MSPGEENVTGAKAGVLGYKERVLACLYYTSALRPLGSPTVPRLRHKTKDAQSWPPDQVIASGSLSRVSSGVDNSLMERLWPGWGLA